MKQSQSTLPTTELVGRRDPTRSVAVQQPLLPCLVFSADPLRRERLTRAMSESGWSPVVCQDVGQISVHGARVRTPLAIIDLVGAPVGVREQCQTVCQRLLVAQQTLLAICGRHDDPTEEIWARQLGVWLYLPGMGEREEISLFAAEARDVVEKLFPDLKQNAAAATESD